MTSTASTTTSPCSLECPADVPVACGERHVHDAAGAGLRASRGGSLPCRSDARSASRWLRCVNRHRFWQPWQPRTPRARSTAWLTPPGAGGDPKLLSKRSAYMPTETWTGQGILRLPVARGGSAEGERRRASKIAANRRGPAMVIIVNPTGGRPRCCTLTSAGAASSSPSAVCSWCSSRWRGTSATWRTWSWMGTRKRPPAGRAPWRLRVCAGDSTPWYRGSRRRPARGRAGVLVRERGGVPEITARRRGRSSEH